jgi:formylglycine-generating enzyme required for sulfatase activity
MQKSIQILIPGVLIAALTGCGSSVPDLAAVKANMKLEQLALSEPVSNSVGMVLVPIPAGEFQMGTPVSNASPEDRLEKLIQNPDVVKKIESGETTKEELMKHAQKQADKDRQRKGSPDTPQHPVRITKPFFMSAFEVTQGQFKAVMNEEPWAGQPLVEEGPDYAATYISWEKASAFCQKLSDKESVEYRLPTEAEWEYACRAGTTTEYGFGDDGARLGEHAWYDANAYKADEQYAHEVGQMSPNAWAMYDMHGNAWEWCQDWYARYGQQKKKDAAVDPAGPEKGRHRVWRGGSFAEQTINLRSATRLSFNRRDYRPEFAAGFRVVRAIAP